jgi:hypothetical protein
MLFAEKICQLREEKQLLQRQVSAALEIDNAFHYIVKLSAKITKQERSKFQLFLKACKRT